MKVYLMEFMDEKLLIHILGFVTRVSSSKLKLRDRKQQTEKDDVADDLDVCTIPGLSMPSFRGQRSGSYFSILFSCMHELDASTSTSRSGKKSYDSRI